MVSYKAQMKGDNEFDFMGPSRTFQAALSTKDDLLGLLQS